MRASRLIAALYVITAWAMALLIPIPTWGWAIPVLVTVIAVGAAVVYERNTSGGSAEARRQALYRAIRARAHAATPDQQANIAGMEEDARDAVQKLTGSMPGQAARHAIDAIPWFLVMGLPESGKSSMLGASGQQFAYVTPSGGARGNRGARWWLTSNAAWIDTAGQYVLAEAGQAEWLAMLRMLESMRAWQPVHGVVVTLGADYLVNTRIEDVDAAARRMRDRLDEVLGFLGVDVPVYLMVTRCDTLPGFVEFYADLREAERGQVWGFTVPIAETGASLPKRFQDGFDELVSIVSHRLYRRVAIREHLETRTRAYQFPQWYAGLRKSLLQFSSVLFAHNRYQERVTGRGLYFTSAAEAVAVSGGLAAYAQQPTGARGYFLRDLMNTLVLTGAKLATRSEPEWRRRRQRDYLGASAMVCAAALLAGLGYASFRENESLLTSYDAAMRATVGARPPASEVLHAAHGAQVARVRELTAKPPIYMRYGLFIGDDLRAKASLLYGALVSRDVVTPALALLRNDLTRFRNEHLQPTAVPTSDDRVRFNDALNLYLLLTTPRAPDDPNFSDPGKVDWVVLQMEALWARLRPTADERSRAARSSVMRTYAEILAEDPRLGTPRDPVLVQSVRVVLAR